MASKGKLRAIHDDVIVMDMEFKEERTTSGIFIPNQDGKVEGIKARWGKVFAVGPEQHDVTVGQWIYVDHGRWTRGVTMEDEDGNKFDIRKVDNKDILLISDDKPLDYNTAK